MTTKTITIMTTTTTTYIILHKIFHSLFISDGKHLGIVTYKGGLKYFFVFTPVFVISRITVLRITITLGMTKLTHNLIKC